MSSLGPPGDAAACGARQSRAEAQRDFDEFRGSGDHSVGVWKSA